MNNDNFLNGQLIVSQPCSQDPYFSKSVILVAQHNSSGAWGVIINRRAKSVSMKHIMSAVGIDHPLDEPVYVGGPVEPTRVQVIHTLDWSSINTLYISDNLGVTGDISILSAISNGTGPKLYRAGVGLSVWAAGQLEGEQSGVEPWTKNHQWLVATATADICLSGSGEEQWQRAIQMSVQHRISELF